MKPTWCGPSATNQHAQAPSDSQLPAAAVLPICSAHFPAPDTSIFSLPHRNKVPTKRSQAQQEPAHGILWGISRSPANEPAGGTVSLAPDRAAGREGTVCDDMQTVQRERKSGRGQGRCQDVFSNTAGPAQKKTIAGTPRHRREEEKRSSSGIQISISVKTKTEKQQHHKSRTSRYSSIESLGLGGVLKESPLTTHKKTVWLFKLLLNWFV